MRRITQPMHRYGEPDFDEDYLRWGFHDRDTQRREAESLLAIVRPASALRILDLGCGLGTHAVYWVQQGHAVTAVDLSETFLRHARRAAAEAGVQVEFRLGDVRELGDEEAFDLVTWIESSFFDQAMGGRILRALRPGGAFVTDVRNPDHPWARARSGNWRTWREENGVFFLERHETDPETGRHEDAWITIDPEREVVEERVDVGDPSQVKHPRMAGLLRDAGFRDVALVTMAGDPFTGGEEPYWLWLVARR